MLKPTPIKRNPALVRFSKDHHFALLLIWKVRQGLRFDIEPQRINNYIIFFFQNYLEAHFKEEEEFLFVHLDSNSGSRIIAGQDHAALKEIVAEIKSYPKNKTISNEFITRLEKHIRFEERKLFNELQIMLDKPELDTIAEKMEALHPHQQEDNWKDTFWLKV